MDTLGEDDTVGGGRERKVRAVWLIEFNKLLPARVPA